MSTIGAADTRHQVLSGILLTTAAYMLFSMQDAAIKLLVAGISVWQVMFFRGIVILSGCIALGGPRLFAEAARSPILKQMFVRSLLILAAWLCYYTAARSLQLAELTTIYFSAPLIITVLSVVMLGEKVPAIRWACVMFGFVGVFVACDPGDLGLSTPVLLVLAASFIWALAMVMMRGMAQKERSMVQLVLNTSFFLAFSGVPMLFYWETPDTGEMLLLVTVGALGGMGQFTLFEGLKRAPMSTLAPFEYTALIWAFLLGFAIWGDVPRQAVFVGAALIAASALAVVVHERFRNPA